MNKSSDRISINSGFELKPIENLNIEPSIRFVRGTDPEDADYELFKQVVTRTRVSWQVNNYGNETFTDNLNQYDLFSYDTRENQRKFFFKLQYLFLT